MKEWFLNSIFGKMTTSVIAFFKKNSFLTYIILAITIWTGGFLYCNEDTTKNIYKMGQQISLAIISGGVWASIVKSQFLKDIFNEEVRNIIYSKENLSNRKDIKDIWGRVSKAMYKSKFPQISEEITDKISNVYLPTNHDYYNEKYNYSINIEWKSDSYIELTEVEETKIITNDKTFEFVFSFQNWIDILPEDESNSTIKTSYTLTSININGMEVDVEKYLKINTNKPNELVIKYDQKISGFKSYEIKKKETKIYSINANSYKSYRSKVFTKDLTLDIFHPIDLKIDFLETGTVHRFKNNPLKSPSADILRLRKTSKEIIFPRQGFCLVFNKKIKKS